MNVSSVSAHPVFVEWGRLVCSCAATATTALWHASVVMPLVFSMHFDRSLATEIYGNNSEIARKRGRTDN
jgi:hypothetical protein